MGYGFNKSLKYYLNCLLDVIYGGNSECILCKVHTEDMLCDSCREKVNYAVIEGKIEKGNRSIKYYSCAYYNSAVKEMIIRLKYKSDFNSGRVLVQMMEKLIKEEALDVNYITYVPSDKGVLKKRGYNQSEFLCKALGEGVGMKVVDTLVKNMATKDQIGLDGNARWNNLKNCFKIKNYKDIKDKKILLIDDVITTGATAFHCACALLESGCSEVTILTVAKSAI